MPTQTKTREMSHADSLAVLNVTAKKEAMKEVEKKKQNAINKKKEEEEQAIKIKEASKVKKRDSVRLKAVNTARITQVIKKEAKKRDNVNFLLMALSTFD